MSTEIIIIKKHTRTHTRRRNIPKEMRKYNNNIYSVWKLDWRATTQLSGRLHTVTNSRPSPSVNVTTVEMFATVKRYFSCIRRRPPDDEKNFVGRRLVYLPTRKSRNVVGYLPFIFVFTNKFINLNLFYFNVPKLTFWSI